MAVTNHRISSYQYEVRQEPDQGVARGLALLYLYDEGKTLLAVLVFRDAEGSMDLPQETAAGHITAQFPRGELADFVDMLRNEKPVYFSWNPELQSLRISSAEEPVGEQELRKLLSWLYV